MFPQREKNLRICHVFDSLLSGESGGDVVLQSAVHKLMIYLIIFGSQLSVNSLHVLQSAGLLFSRCLTNHQLVCGSKG